MATAVGYDLVIDQPSGPTDPAWLGVILGGPAFFLAGRARFEHEVFGRVSRSRWTGLLALVALAPVLAVAPPLAAAIAAALNRGGGGSSRSNGLRCAPHGSAAVRRPTGDAGRIGGPTLEVALTAQHPAAVLFDMDGTLVDSEKLWDVALDELAARYGGRLSLAARRSMVGTSMAESMAILHADLGQPWRDPAAGASWMEKRVAELFVSGLPWRPGARALLQAVRAAGIPTALVTSTARALVEVALDTLGRDSFDVVVCGDEVHAPKPDPMPYLTAARLLDVPISRCVAVEDSPTGVASALAAGAAVLAVPSEVPLDAHDGVHLLDSLTGADLERLAALLARSGGSDTDESVPAGRAS